MKGVLGISEFCWVIYLELNIKSKDPFDSRQALRVIEIGNKADKHRVFETPIMVTLLHIKWYTVTILKKSSYRRDFEKCRTTPQLVQSFKPTRILSAFITIAKHIHIIIQLKYEQN